MHIVCNVHLKSKLYDAIPSDLVINSAVVFVLVTLS